MTGPADGQGGTFHVSRDSRHPQGIRLTELDSPPHCWWCGTEDPETMRTSPFWNFCGTGCFRMYYEARTEAARHLKPEAGS